MKQQDEAVRLYGGQPSSKDEKSSQKKQSGSRPSGLSGAIFGGMNVFGRPNKNAATALGQSVKGTLRDFGVIDNGTAPSQSAAPEPIPQEAAPPPARAITAPRPGTPENPLRTGYMVPVQPEPVPQASAPTPGMVPTDPASVLAARNATRALLGLPPLTELPEGSTPEAAPSAVPENPVPAWRPGSGPPTSAQILAARNAARRLIGLPPMTQLPSGINPAPKALPALAQINAQRARQGLPPLTPDQAAELMTSF
jgi:uncharacterized protein YkwD